MFSCNQHENKSVKTLKIDTEGSKRCFVFKNRNGDTIKFNRKISIKKNTINDTIILGNSVLAPKFTGGFEYTKFKNRTDVIVDLQYLNSTGDRVWVIPYKNKVSKGFLEIELTTTTNNEE
jgi:hypothetical protein